MAKMNKDNHSTSRQRQYQLDHSAAGLCAQCNRPRAPGNTLCVAHRLASRRAGRNSKNVRARNILGVSVDHDEAYARMEAAITRSYIRVGAAVTAQKFKIACATLYKILRQSGVEPDWKRRGSKEKE